MKYVFLACLVLGTNLYAMNIQDAQKIASQFSMGSDKSWCCGPNSLARFLTVSGYEFAFDERDNLCHFTTNCPRSGGKPTSQVGYLSCASLIGASAACLGYGWDGYSDVVIGVSLAVAGSAPFIIEHINNKYGAGKVGPTPKWLAGYANKFLAEQQVLEKVAARHFSEPDALHHELNAYLAQEKPVIALVNYAPLMWHYIVLTKFDTSTNNYEYLDTNREIYNISQEELFSQMDFHRQTPTKILQKVLANLGWTLNVDIGRYNIIVWENSRD